MNVINILLCSDEGYAQHMVVCIVSFLKNSPKSRFNIVIVGDFKSQDVLNKIHQSIDSYSNATLKIIKFEIDNKENYPVMFHYTMDIYKRLWVDSFFPKDVDKVLYLDSDMVVVGDIAELWNADIDGKVLGAVPIPWFDRTHLPNFKPEYGYFNSGVLLFNMKEWRAQRCEEEVLNFILNNSAILIDPDQDALNDCFYGRYKKLPYEWNLIRSFYGKAKRGELSDEYRVSLSKEKIIHYNGGSKPWHYMDNHPKKHCYNDYLAYTAWSHVKPKDKTVMNMLRKGFSLIVPHHFKMLIKTYIK